VGEDTLVRRCLAGEQEACTEFVDIHSRMVGTVIWRAVGDQTVVADLAQETFMRAFRALPYFARRSKLSTWVCTIAHRVAIDHLRKVRRYRDETPLSAAKGSQSQTLDPEAVAVRDETTQLVQAALTRLPDKFRLPLVYAAIDGLDYETIAAMLELPVGTVKTHIFRGKSLLRDMIAEALESRMRTHRD
jgi:RNA polymerase sigma-70 factor (ECF subfamily)